jgi:hypothetical protein
MHASPPPHTHGCDVTKDMHDNRETNPTFPCLKNPKEHDGLFHATHCKDKILKFGNKYPEKEYHGLSPTFHIHASVSNLYIPTIGLPILLEEICRPILGLYKSLTDT